jgi:hypothetical protein
MSPNYCQYIQHLLYHVVLSNKLPRCQHMRMDSFSHALRGLYADVRGIILEGRTKAKHDAIYASGASFSRRGSRGTVSKTMKGAAKFFTN